MKDIDEIRRENFIRLLGISKFSKSELARRIGKVPQYINGIINEGKNFSDEMAGVFAAGLEVDKSEFYRGLVEEDTFGSFGMINVPSPQIEMSSDSVKGGNIKSKLVEMIGNILEHGTDGQIASIYTITKIIDADITAQKKAAPMINASESEGVKVA